MEILWTLNGAKWQEKLRMPIDTPPHEVATRGLENRFLKEDSDTELGIILELSHEKMKSEDDHLILLTSVILANAGFYSLASELEKEVSALLGEGRDRDEEWRI